MVAVAAMTVIVLGVVVIYVRNLKYLRAWAGAKAKHACVRAQRKYTNMHMCARAARHKQATVWDHTKAWTQQKKKQQTSVYFNAPTYSNICKQSKETKHTNKPAKPCGCGTDGLGENPGNSR